MIKPVDSTAGLAAKYRPCGDRGQSPVRILAGVPIEGRPPNVPQDGRPHRITDLHATRPAWRLHPADHRREHPHSRTLAPGMLDHAARRRLNQLLHAHGLGPNPHVLHLIQQLVNYESDPETGAAEQALHHDVNFSLGLTQYRYCPERRRRRHVNH
jgi:hypothetical protein